MSEENTPPVTAEDTQAIQQLYINVLSCETEMNDLLEVTEIVLNSPNNPLVADILRSSEVAAEIPRQDATRHERIQHLLGELLPLPPRENAEDMQQAIRSIQGEQQEQREILLSMTQALEQIIANTYVTQDTQELLQGVSAEVGQIHGQTTQILKQTTAEGVIAKICNLIAIMLALLVQVRDLINRFRPSRYLTGSGPIITVLRLVALFLELSIFLTVLKLFIELFGYDGNDTLVYFAKLLANKIAALYVKVFQLLINLGSPVFKVLRAFGEGIMEEPLIKQHYDSLVAYLEYYFQTVLNASGISAIIDFIRSNEGILGAASAAKDAVVDQVVAAKDAVVDQVVAAKDAVVEAVTTRASNALASLAHGALASIQGLGTLGTLGGLFGASIAIAGPTQASNNRAIGFTQDQLFPTSVPTFYLEYLPPPFTGDQTLPVLLPGNFTIPENVSSLVFNSDQEGQLSLQAFHVEVAEVEEDIEVLYYKPLDFLRFEPFKIVELNREYFNVGFEEVFFETYDVDEYAPNPKGGYKSKRGGNKSLKLLINPLIKMKDLFLDKYKNITNNEDLKINNKIKNIFLADIKNLHIAMTFEKILRIILQTYMIIFIKKKLKEAQPKGGKRKEKSRKYMRHKTHKRFRHKNKKGSKKRYKGKRHSKRRTKK
jgi:hypothetical protein